MDFELNETQVMVQKAAREYATRAILPEAAAIDHEERFPRAQLKGLAELGLMAVNVPEALGGAAAGPVSYALAMQEVARACASTAVTMAASRRNPPATAATGAGATTTGTAASAPVKGRRSITSVVNAASPTPRRAPPATSAT